MPAQINARVSPALAVEIEQYARGLGLSKSAYGALVYQWWMEQGCPPVCEEDREARESAEVLKIVKDPKRREGLLKQLSYARR